MLIVPLIAELKKNQSVLIATIATTKERYIIYINSLDAKNFLAGLNGRDGLRLGQCLENKKIAKIFLVKLLVKLLIAQSIKSKLVIFVKKYVELVAVFMKKNKFLVVETLNKIKGFLFITYVDTELTLCFTFDNF